LRPWSASANTNIQTVDPSCYSILYMLPQAWTKFC